MIPRTPADIERAREGFRRISARIADHLVLVLGHDPVDLTEAGVRCGGTGFLVSTSEQRFLVTADHVISGILDQGLTPVIVGDRGKNIALWTIIDCSKSVDIATIEIPPTFDPSRIARRYFSPARWPPPRAQRGESALFAGFQGARRIPGEGTLTAPGATIADFVVSSTDRHFIVADEHKERVRRRGRRPRSTGGMSGAPVFVPRDRGPEWVGVLYEGKDTAGQFFVSHADFVLPSGRIDRGRIAWKATTRP